MLKVALVGNPNSGKTSLFNQLTGLNQKVGNFPGVTVDKKTGRSKIQEQDALIVDLPGTYSIYPRSLDERVVINFLTDPQNAERPDAVVVVVDASNLERNLLLFSQIKDLGYPIVLALNMLDTAEQNGISIDVEQLEIAVDTEVVQINARKGKGLSGLRAAIVKARERSPSEFFSSKTLAIDLIEEIKDQGHCQNDYQAYLLAQQLNDINYLSPEEIEWLAHKKAEYDFQDRKLQEQETVGRYARIKQILKTVQSLKSTEKRKSTEKIDDIITHPVYGYAIFFGILLLIFQSIFSWAEPLMDLIDEGFGLLGAWVHHSLPEGVLNDLLAEGIIPGLGGVVIFIPQIALLFGFIAILEETGYMARVVFLMDKIMVKVGLNGKSVVPLISGMACAIPAIMATRTINNWKDRLITIFVTPFMSCSARLPIYAILIGLIVPNEAVLGVFNLQGLALMAMYLLGFAMAMGSAYAMKLILQTSERSYFVMELPVYRMPRWPNVGITIVEKSRTFVVEAGKVILAISIILWVLASYGSSSEFDNAEQWVKQHHQNLPEEEQDDLLASRKLEFSYAGMLGKSIEPIIKPLGFDWKIGIALISSFAAREVFVGTIATIYSVGSDFEDEITVRSRLKAEVNPDTGGAMYTPALGFSLMVFYVFAMQCMSTLAIVYRETKGWKWPLLQLGYMTAIAYLASFITYTILS